jgi:hypothetical protein
LARRRAACRPARPRAPIEIESIGVTPPSLEPSVAAPGAPGDIDTRDQEEDASMPTYDVRKLIGPLGIVSVLETISFLLVIVAMAVLDQGEARSLAGAFHGMLFTIYAVLLFLTHRVLGWSRGFAALGVLTGPIGAIVVLERLRRRAAAPAPAPAE